MVGVASVGERERAARWSSWSVVDEMARAALKQTVAKETASKE